MLAAAVASQAEIIVTANLKHFQADSTEPHGIKVQDPDSFLEDLFDLNPALSLSILERQADDQVHPPITIEDLLMMLSKAGAPRFANSIRDQLGSAPPTLW